MLREPGDDDVEEEGEEIDEEDDYEDDGGDFSTPPQHRHGTPAGASATLFRRYAEMPVDEQGLTPASVSRRKDQLDAINEIVAPMYHREKAREYLEAMVESGPASFNPYTKELLIDGSPIHKSNIRQVLRYFLNTKKNKPDVRKTQGVYEFQKVLPIVETIVELRRRERQQPQQQQQGQGGLNRWGAGRKIRKRCCTGSGGWGDLRRTKKRKVCLWKKVKGLIDY